MSNSYSAYILHDGMLAGESFNGFVLSESARETVKQMLPGTFVGHNLEQSGWAGYKLQDVIGQVRLIDRKLVVVLEHPMDERLAAMLRPALSLVVSPEELDPSGSQIVSEVLAVSAVALVPKEEGDLGWLEPYVDTAVEETGEGDAQ